MLQLEQKPFLTVEDVADLYKIRPVTLLLWNRQNRLPKPLRVGRKLLWRADQLPELMKGPKQKGEVK
jgi:hypothetical protein